MANTSAHFRGFELSSSLCVAAVAFTLGMRPALGRPDMTAEYGGIGPIKAGAPAAATAETVTAETITATEYQARLNALYRALPQEPNPVFLEVSSYATAQDLRGKDGIGLALGILAGAILVGMLLVLFLGLSGWLWAEDEDDDARGPQSELHPR